MKQFILLLLVALALAEAKELSRNKRALPVDLDAFMQQNLDCHNKYRNIHQVGPLTYSPELNEYAQDYADEMAEADLFEHSGGPYGENIYGSTGTVDGNSACLSWYSESENYDYTQDNPPNFSEVGHFTQLVWKGTQQTGVGIATSESGWTYVVSEYSPPGNFQNEYKSNVFPPK